MEHQQQNLELPLVSVIIPAYNAEEFIERTLKSVVSQTYKNIEVVVVDDGSQDCTSKIVQSIAQVDRRVLLVDQPNKGVAAARNLAIEKSKGQYIAPIDADDIWYPQKLEKQVQCMLQSKPSVGLVYAWTVTIDDEDLMTGGYQDSKEEGEVYLSLIVGNFIGNASTPLIRRSCFEQVGGYNCRLKEENAQGCEDWDLYLRIAERYEFRVVPEFLIGYRETTASMSHQIEAMAKSYLLVLADAQKRNQQIPKKIYQRSLSGYSVYIAHKYSIIGKHWSSLLWLYKVVKHDPGMLINYTTYQLTLKFLIKLAIHPVIYLLWGQYDWLKFKRQFTFGYRALKIFTPYRLINAAKNK